MPSPTLSEVPPPGTPIGTELLDDPDAPAAVVRRVLPEVARANALFGGTTALRYALGRLLETTGRGSSLTLLDVGTGCGDLPNDAVRWGNRTGITIRPLGLERHHAAAGLAATAGVTTLIGDGNRLPLADRSVDLVLMSQLLHHFDDGAAVKLMSEATRVARRGVVVLDLRPSTAVGLGFRLAGAVLGFDRRTVDDGVTSLKRGRSGAELAALARRAGARQEWWRHRPVARVVVGWRID